MTTTETSELSALDMARNALGSMKAHVQYVIDGDTDPEKAIRAQVNAVSARADQDSKVAARMALVSIAEDLHRIAAPAEESDPGDNAIEAYCAVGTGDPRRLLQYAVEKDGATKTYGDQSWVKSGAAAADVGGTTMVRDIRVSYGPWRKAAVTERPPSYDGGWQSDWELTGRDGDGNAVLKHKETGGRYRIIPEEDL